MTIDEQSLSNDAGACAEHLAIMEQGLISLESGGAQKDGELVNRLLQATRAVLAGASRCRLAKIHTLAQRTEHALTPLSLSRETPPPERVTVLLRAIDTLRAMLHDPDEGAGVDTTEIMRALGSATRDRAPSHAANWRLRTLLAEDDFTGRLLLQTFLARYGDCHVAVNGREAVEAFRAAIEQGNGYELICMDIMMPEMDGAAAVRAIRAIEEARGILPPHGAKIVMTTAVNQLKEVMHCFHDLCDAYIVKPIDLAQLLEQMKSNGLIDSAGRA